MYMEEDESKTKPLIDQQIEIEYDSLLKEHKIFLSCIDDLMQHIDRMNYNEPLSIQNIKAKYNIIQKKFNQIYKTINYLKNFIRDERSLKFKQIQRISELISVKNSKANEKVLPIIQKAQINLQEEIKNERNEKKSENQIQISKEEIKNNRKYQSLLEAQKEYESIYKITQELNQLSKEMKESVIRQNEMTNSINDNVIELERNTDKANEEIDILHRNQKKDNSKYIIGSLILVLIILFIGILIYLKLIK